MLSCCSNVLPAGTIGSSSNVAGPSLCASTRLESSYQTLTDEQLRAKTDEFRDRFKAGETLDQLLPEAFAVVKNAARRLLRAQDHRLRARADLGHGAFRRPADRRHRAARGQDRRDGHRRGQDPGRHAAALPQRPDRPQRPARHRQRLPRPARLRVDGLPLQLPRRHRRLHPAADAPRPAPGNVRPRHHLRHGQRVRLRLPARQRHGHAQGGPGAARPLVLHRGRGGLDPGRRGAHAAHHLRPGARSSASSRSPG